MERTETYDLKIYCLGCLRVKEKPEEKCSYCGSDI